MYSGGAVEKPLRGVVLMSICSMCGVSGVGDFEGPDPFDCDFDFACGIDGCDCFVGGSLAAALVAEDGTEGSGEGWWFRGFRQRCGLWAMDVEVVELAKSGLQRFFGGKSVAASVDSVGVRPGAF